MNKATLRKQLRDRRRALSAPDRRHRSLAAAKAVTRLRFFRAGRRVALYLPLDAEPDTGALIAAARRRGVKVFVPVISDRRHCRMRFYPLTRATEPGAFGIAVPRLRVNAVSPRWLDLIVIPLVGVDGDGRRLGMGGGYYDRALAFRRRRRVWRGPHLIGLAFDCQRTEVQFAEPWDLRLDSLATESGVQHFL